MTEESASDKYVVKWSEEDQEFVGLHKDHPYLSFLAKTEEGALKGIYKLVYDVYVDENFSDEKLLVMSNHEIAENSSAATGIRISVKEAKLRFGAHIIHEIIDKGSAIIDT